MDTKEYSEYNEKDGIGHGGSPEVIHDRDIVGDKERGDAMHLGELSAEELMHEKQLRKKIDSVIMPMVVLVCLGYCMLMGESQLLTEW